MSGPFDAPTPPEGEHSPPVLQDPFAGARSEIWHPLPHHRQESSMLDALTQPKAILGEGLFAGGLIGRCLLSAALGQKLALAAAGAGLVITALSLADPPKLK